MSTKQEQPTVSIETQKLNDWNDQFFKIDPRMARKLAFEKKQFVDKRGKQKIEESSEKPLDPRMARKLDFENQKHQERQEQEKGIGSTEPKLDSVPNIPLPWPRKKEIDANINRVKQLPVEERKPKWEHELTALDDMGKKLIADTKLGNEQKKPIALDFKTGKETIQKEMANDVNEIKQLKLDRKKLVTDQLEAIKQTMSQVEKIPSDKGEVTQAITAYQASKSTLLKLLNQDMTADNFSKADATVKKLKADAEKALALNKAKQDRINNSKQIVNKLGANIVPDETGSFPQGSTKAISKETDRAVLGHGPLFKPVLKGLEEVEKSPVEKNLATLEIAAKNYLADYDRRVKEGQESGKAFKPDKITTNKAQACRDALEKIRKLRVARDIQGEIAKLPKDPRSPEEEQQLNRLKAKILVESGGSKQLDSSESGASESFFLSDPTTGEKNFIFKPSDGEHDAGYGWKKGGGAPREVVLSSVNEALKNSIGLDCGVSQTTLVAVDSPTVATDKNGNNSKRVGAVQNFVKSDKGLTDKLDQNKINSYDKDYINQIPAEEIEKVALLDFVTLQMDRQPSNLLIQPDSNGAPRLTPIDAGNAMPSRKAFEASRRMFTNNAVLSGDEAKKPFSPDAISKINELDEDAIAKAMQKANSDMASVDKDASTAVEDETIEMTRRSIRFLKKAAPQLTKAEIADAYANLFYKVLDAKPKDVDRAIDDAIQEQLAKPAQLKAIDQFPKNSQRFKELGWPTDEYESMRRENPAKLLDILQKDTPCKATVDKINEIIKEVGLKNFDTDPNTIADINKRYIEVSSKKTKNEELALINDPELPKKMKKLGVEFVTINQKGEKNPVTSNTGKARIAKSVNDYLAAGGDDELKRRGKNPGKMTFEQKVFESLGGQELIDKLEKEGQNVYNGPKIEYKISDLTSYKEYIALGGDKECVRLGCPQNKEVTFYNRTVLMKQKQSLE